MKRIIQVYLTRVTRAWVTPHRRLSSAMATGLVYAKTAIREALKIQVATLPPVPQVDP